MPGPFFSWGLGRAAVCNCGSPWTSSSSSWGRGRAAVCDCGTPWTFLLPFFADYMAKGAPTEDKMQKGQVTDSCDSYDLTISIKMTEVVYQPALGKPYKEPAITVKSQRLQVVDKFTYLRSTLSRIVHIDYEVNAGLPKLVQHLKYLGSKWNQTTHKAESLQICGAANTIIRMRNLDSLPAACQKTGPPPYKLS